MKDLTKGNINKAIITFAIPVLIGNLFNLAYNLADTRIIGSFLGNDALAAVGAISTLSDLLVGLVVGIANGFAVITAQYFGKKQEERVRKTWAMSILLGIGIALFLTVLCVQGMNGIMQWLNISAEHRNNSSAYMVVILYGLVFSMFYNITAANLRAIGDAFTPLIFLIISATLNVGLDLLCVGVWGMGVKGAAYATVFSQLFSAVLCFVYSWIKYPIVRFTLSDFVWDGHVVKKIIPAGMSMGFMSCLIHIGTVTLQSAINGLGTNIIVAHAAARKLTNIYMLPFAVLGTAMATFSGQNFGAGKLDRIKEGIKRTVIMGWIWSAFVIVANYFFGAHLVVAITDTKITEVIETACLYQRVDTLFYFVLPIITVFRSSLQGMGDHVTPIVSSSMEMIGKIIVALALTPIIGYWGIIISEPAVWLVMVIPLIVSMAKRLRYTEGSNSKNASVDAEIG